MATKQRKTLVEFNPSEQGNRLARAADFNLDAPVLNRIREVFEAYAYVAALLERKDLSLARLQRPLFGDTTETSQNVLGVDRPGVATIIELGATAIFKKGGLPRFW